MIKIICWGAESISKLIGEFESIQVTSGLVRDPDGNLLLYYFEEDNVWFDEETGNGWYDWTVEAI